MTLTTQLSGTPPSIRILVAEDEPELREYLQLALRRPNFVIDFAEDGEQVVNSLSSACAPALLILDVVMPRKDGLTTLKEIRQHDLNLPIIMLSGMSSAANIVEAIKSGANDYLTKPISHQDLRQAVDQLLGPSSREASVVSPLSGSFNLNLRNSNWAQKIEPLLDRLASSDAPVLMQGETGVGKEVLARRIHDQSSRSGRIFLKLNCAALPSELVESELFGYERGAFTGAFKNNPGKFELADGGTILLDEIGDMDHKLQAKLLQVLQDHEYLRLGAREPTRVNVRVIASTHCDLESRIKEGQFREDLYYRLNVVNIVIPPLRERSDEIVPLATFFLRRHSRPDASIPELGADLRTALLRHRWPGNIRELENVMRQYLVVRNSQTIIDDLEARARRERHPESRSAEIRGTQFHSPASLPPAPTSGPFSIPEVGVPADMRASGSARWSVAESKSSELTKVEQARREAEIEVITKALHSTLWNRKRAAALLGTDYKSLLYKMKKLGIG